PPQRLNATGEIFASWTLEDYDADGDLDLAVVSSTSCTTCRAMVRILANDGTGTFSSSGLPALPYSGRLSSADVNGDGRLDLLLTGFGSASAPNDTLKVLRNLGSSG